MRVYERGSGLLVAERAAVPRSVADALRRLDPRLELRQERDEAWQAFVWRVFVAQPDRPSVWLFDWREETGDGGSRPLPLSHGLVEEAAARRLGSRRPVEDPLEANDRRAEAERRQDVAEHLALAEEAERRGRRQAVLPRSRGLYLSRARARARARGEAA